MDGSEGFEDAIATTNLLPGPASTQLAIYCGLAACEERSAPLSAARCFIVPGSAHLGVGLAVFLANPPPIGSLARRPAPGRRCPR